MAMRHVRVTDMGRDQDDSERGRIHYAGAGITGSHTLCGHMARVPWTWEDTTKPVNCRECLGIRNHVLGRQ
jgi:hypothetical protein